MFKVVKAWTKYDRFGHLKSSNEVSESCNTLQEAMDIAERMNIKKSKNATITVFDLNGAQEDPKDPKSTLWLVCSIERDMWYFNDYYKQLGKRKKY